MKNTAELRIEEVVSVGLACLEQGLDNKTTVKNNILKAVSQNSILIHETHSLEEFPTDVFYWLHNEFGLGFEIHDGKIISAYVEEGGLNPLKKGKVERLFSLSHVISEKGIDFGSTPDVGIYNTFMKGGEEH
ncbi:hypothetical protein [Ruminiclostridium papyrosolvens]|uniref:Uncharacterized protein n=1 Tax=Ruminiclostridium papyrosolvens C7 TaxID=1330534 RepID=U4QXZ3_9FIRM|nr:hypothetical protein [Ruminiclostridium papyrosolvens]EPR07782.1 hypothetical protein L323_19990 [Ruminiclostridium papyrosolvens C7]